MAKITVMSYKDAGAPQVIANDRRAFYTLLDTWLIQGYNNQVVSRLTCDKQAKTITLQFETDHLYKEGQLLLIQGATYQGFNKPFRIVQTVNRIVTLRIDKEDLEDYPEVDENVLSITTKVAPANWEPVFSSSTQRSYRSRADFDRSSKLFYTFKQPVNPLLVSAGAVCYSVDISKNLDTATGTPLDSVFLSTRSETDGSNFYVLTDVYTTPITNVNNGKGDTMLPWFCIASDTFVYFMLGGYTDRSTTIGTADPSTFLSHYRNYPRSKGYYTTLQQYYFGDIEAFHPQEYINQTSAVYSFYHYKQDVLTSVEIQMYMRYPSYSYTSLNAAYSGWFVDTFVPSNTPNMFLSSTSSILNTHYSYASGHGYSPLPFNQQNLEGVFEAPFYAVQTNDVSWANELKRQYTVVRGILPFGVYISNALMGFLNMQTQEFVPLRFIPKDPLNDDWYVVGLGNTRPHEFVLDTNLDIGFSVFKLD